MITRKRAHWPWLGKANIVKLNLDVKSAEEEMNNNAEHAVVDVVGCFGYWLG